MCNGADQPIQYPQRLFHTLMGCNALRVALATSIPFHRASCSMIPRKRRNQSSGANGIRVGNLARSLLDSVEQLKPSAERPMPQSIPSGLTREHILQAIAELEAGTDHSFGPPTKFQLVHEGKRYP